MSEKLIYSHTLAMNAPTWLQYPEIRENAERVQATIFARNMAEEGYEPLPKAKVTETLEFYRIVTSEEEDEDGVPLWVRHEPTEPGDATHVKRTIETLVRMVK